VFRNVGKSNQTPDNQPRERIQHSQHGEKLKARLFCGKILVVENIKNGNIIYICY